VWGDVLQIHLLVGRRCPGEDVTQNDHGITDGGKNDHVGWCVMKPESQ
jgi:hypothetical protein